MPRLTEVDWTILRVVRKLGKARWIDLLRDPEIGKTVKSPRTLDKHLKYLIELKEIKRCTKTRSKRNYYALTRRARTQAQVETRINSFRAALSVLQVSLMRRLVAFDMRKRIEVLGRYQLAVQSFLLKREVVSHNALERALLAGHNTLMRPRLPATSDHLLLYAILGTAMGVEPYAVGPAPKIEDERALEAWTDEFSREYAFLEYLYEHSADEAFNMQAPELKDAFLRALAPL